MAVPPVPARSQRMRQDHRTRRLALRLRVLLLTCAVPFCFNDVGGALEGCSAWNTGCCCGCCCCCCCPWSGCWDVCCPKTPAVPGGQYVLADVKNRYSGSFRSMQCASEKMLVP